MALFSENQLVICVNPGDYVRHKLQRLKLGEYYLVDYRDGEIIKVIHPDFASTAPGRFLSSRFKAATQKSEPVPKGGKNA